MPNPMVSLGIEGDKDAGAGRVLPAIRPLGLQLGKAPERISFPEISCIINLSDASVQAEFHFLEIRGQKRIPYHNQSKIMPIVNGLEKNRLVNGR